MLHLNKKKSFKMNKSLKKIKCKDNFSYLNFLNFEVIRYKYTITKLNFQYTSTRIAYI